MTAFSHPLIALSLTVPDEGLLRYAAVLAARLDWRDVQFGHVVPTDHAKTEAPGAVTWQARVAEEVRRYFGQPMPDCRASFFAVEGPRLDQLLTLAGEQGRDVLVLGHCRGHSGRRSLARRLAMLAPSSVWLVPEDSPPTISSILVPTDFSSHSADALGVAIAIARASGLNRCHVVHVFFDPSTIRYDEHVDEVLGREEAAFEKFLAAVDTQGVQVEPIFHESTHPPQAILRVAERYSSDLIVMNTRGRSHAASILLGSITSATMAATTIPILAVKHYGSHIGILQALANHRVWEKGSPKANRLV